MLKTRFLRTLCVSGLVIITHGEYCVRFKFRFYKVLYIFMHCYIFASVIMYYTMCKGEKSEHDWRCSELNIISDALLQFLPQPLSPYITGNR